MRRTRWGQSYRGLDHGGLWAGESDQHRVRGSRGTGWSAWKWNRGKGRVRGVNDGEAWQVHSRRCQFCDLKKKAATSWAERLCWLLKVAKKYCEFVVWMGIREEQYLFTWFLHHYSGVEERQSEQFSKVVWPGRWQRTKRRNWICSGESCYCYVIIIIFKASLSPLPWFKNLMKTE